MSREAFTPPLPLLCTVRGCGNALQPTEPAGALRCPRGHSFDVARTGHVNLLQPQDRRSLAAGDAPEIVAARARWISSGRLDPLVRRLRDRIASLALPSSPAVLDAGCGEGGLLRAIALGQGWRVAGVDLSAAAIRAAAAPGRGEETPAAAAPSRFVWIVANADRLLPVVEATVDLGLSLFGRRNLAEFHRVLRPGGFLLLALPGRDDLVELREAVLGEPQLVNRADPALAALAPGFEVLPSETWSHRLVLDRQGIADALKMTYRGERRRQRPRVEALERLEVTLSSELLLARREAGEAP